MTDKERKSRLAYREELRKAVERGDEAFIEREIEKNQLTPEELRRLEKNHTPIEEWFGEEEETT